MNCPDCDFEWEPTLEPRCPNCQLDIEDLHAAAGWYDEHIGNEDEQNIEIL